MEQSVTPSDEGRYRILVPIANPQTARELLDFSALVAKAHDAEILLVHVITIPKRLAYKPKIRAINVNSSA